MVQPTSFMDHNCPHHVCKLHKALYGLKQAPAAWFHRFSNFILRHGFVKSLADPSHFIFHHGTTHLVLLLYVDDIILIGNNFVALQHLIKDFGPLHYFLAIEVRPTYVGIDPSQTKYALDLLKRTSMIDCKPCSTLIASHAQLSNEDGTPLSNP